MHAPRTALHAKASDDCGCEARRGCRNNSEMQNYATTIGTVNPPEHATGARKERARYTSKGRTRGKGRHDEVRAPSPGIMVKTASGHGHGKGRIGTGRNLERQPATVGPAGARRRPPRAKADDTRPPAVAIGANPLDFILWHEAFVNIRPRRRVHRLRGLMFTKLPGTAALLRAMPVVHGMAFSCCRNARQTLRLPQPHGVGRGSRAPLPAVIHTRGANTSVAAWHGRIHALHMSTRA